MRRVSSWTRSGVRATSMPPLSVKTPSSWYWRTLSSVNGGHLLGVVGQEDEVRGVAGRAAGVGQRALVEQHDVAPAEPGQVVGHAVADDAGADDDDPRSIGSAAMSNPPRASWGASCGARLGQPRFRMTIVLSSVRRSIAKRPPTRPTPLCEPARPPKGRCDSQ